MKARLGLRLLLALAPLSCDGDAQRPYADFVVAVENERFALRASDPETIRLARESMRGGHSIFPIGPLRRGDGGFNAPWSWHIDPDQVRMAEAAIEVCDGRPSYVEEHVDDYLAVGYCPWAARVIALKP
jgi:hypothetical protein